MAQEQPHIEQWKSLLEQHITKDAAGKSVLHLASDTLPSPAIQAIFAEYLVDKTLSVDL
jgi:hypothetical protein